METVEDEDIYCEDIVKDTIDNIFDEPPFKTVTEYNLDTSETCWQMKSYLSLHPYIDFCY